MKLFMAFTLWLLATHSGISASMFVLSKLCGNIPLTMPLMFQYYMVVASPSNEYGIFHLILDGPMGKVTFTGVFTNMVNIQVDNGTDVGQYSAFVVKNANHEEICKLFFSFPLNDCSDKEAVRGDNQYEVSAEGKSVESITKRFTARPLDKNCTVPCDTYEHCVSADMKHVIFSKL